MGFRGYELRAVDPSDPVIAAAYSAGRRASVQYRSRIAHRSPTYLDQIARLAEAA